MIHTLMSYLAFGFVVAAVAAFLLVSWLWSVTKDTARIMHRQASRRAVDALFVWLGFNWWENRRQPGRASAPRPPALTGDDIYRACPLSRWTGDPAGCRWCGGPLPEGRARFCRPQCTDEATWNHEFNGDGGARATARRRDRYACRRCGSSTDLEVHHAVEPALGRHEQPGCHHHLDGLVTLCRTCHQAETNQQRRAGQFGNGARARRRRRSHA